MVRIGLLLGLVGSMGLFFSTVAACQEGDATQAKADITVFQGYLKKNYPGKKWQVGPTALDSKEIRKAYEKQRFYFVFSSPPSPPGANVPELIEAYRRNAAAYQKTFISLSISIDERGKIIPLQKPKDYNSGLMKVKTDEDARIAAAAVLSLQGAGRAGPGAVAAKEVTVSKSEKGWSCRVQRPNAFWGVVVFDADGKCTGVAKEDAGAVAVVENMPPLSKAGRISQGSSRSFAIILKSTAET